MDYLWGMLVTMFAIAVFIGLISTVIIMIFMLFGFAKYLWIKLKEGAGEN